MKLRAVPGLQLDAAPDGEPRMKIALIGINYAPETTGIAPYTAGLARGLAARGHDVEVMAGQPHTRNGNGFPGTGDSGRPRKSTAYACEGSATTCRDGSRPGGVPSWS